VTFPIESMQISFNPRGVEAFEDRGSVYHTLEIHDTWGTLKVSSGAALITTSFTDVIVPAAADTSAENLAGDGWSATLAGGFTLTPDPGHPSSYRVRRSGRAGYPSTAARGRRVFRDQACLAVQLRPEAH
jgi:hypothetical protein